MSTNWNVGLMRWKPHLNKEGKAFPLNHLHPFRYLVYFPESKGRPELTVPMQIAFSLHCFTRKTEPHDCATEHCKDDRETRTFDLERYLLSKNLKNIATSLAARSCSFGKNDNYVIVDAVTSNGATIKYGVFFNIKRLKATQEDKVLVVIQSAYGLTHGKPMPGRGKISFNALLNHALKGTKPRSPP